MIRFVPLESVLPLRNQVLREGKLPLDQCIFPGDDREGAFHLAFFQEELPVSIATFHPGEREGFPGTAFQLRGMATASENQGKGFGNLLLNFAIVYLRGRKVNYIWCNARKSALRFYKGIGFEVISPEFEIAGIGPHYVMYLKIQ